MRLLCGRFLVFSNHPRQVEFAHVMTSASFGGVLHRATCSLAVVLTLFAVCGAAQSYWFLNNLPTSALALHHNAASIAAQPASSSSSSVSSSSAQSWGSPEAGDNRLQIINEEQFCRMIEGLNKIQKDVCVAHPHLMIAIARGRNLGGQECMFQFKNERWNCSALQMLRGEHGNANTAGKRFVKALAKLGTREAAFMFSIWSAGITHSVARTCSSGALSICHCGRRKRGSDEDLKGQFIWGGCSDNVRFGLHMTRMFIDQSVKSRRNKRSILHKQNSKSGRSAVRRSRRKKCKCHGVSGACSLRTCWYRIGSFRDIGNYLKRKYNRAIKVKFDRRKRKFVLIAGYRRWRKIPRGSMVYTAKSPNFCKSNPRIGHMGVAGRECNVTSSNKDSCEHLCCGHGYDTLDQVEFIKCHCKFVWCCDVNCQICQKNVWKHRCRGSPQEHASDMSYGR